MFPVTGWVSTSLEAAPAEDYLNDDEYDVLLASNVGESPIKIPNRGMSICSESGLYKIPLRSPKPMARSISTSWGDFIPPPLGKRGKESRHQRSTAPKPTKIKRFHSRRRAATTSRGSSPQTDRTQGLHREGNPKPPL